MLTTLKVSSAEGFGLESRRDRRLHVMRDPWSGQRGMSLVCDGGVACSVIVQRIVEQPVETHTGSADALELSHKTSPEMGLRIELTSSVKRSAPVPTRPSVAYSLKRCQEFVLTFLLVSDLGER